MAGGSRQTVLWRLHGLGAIPSALGSDIGLGLESRGFFNVISPICRILHKVSQPKVRTLSPS